MQFAWLRHTILILSSVLDCCTTLPTICDFESSTHIPLTYPHDLKIGQNYTRQIKVSKPQVWLKILKYRWNAVSKTKNAYGSDFTSKKRDKKNLFTNPSAWYQYRWQWGGKCTGIHLGDQYNLRGNSKMHNSLNAYPWYGDTRPEAKEINRNMH
jgi:hypothetical protein